VLTCLNGDPGVVHVTSDMCKDLGPLETKLADGFTVCSRFRRGSGGSQFDVLDTECVKAGR
jgi:hypothetical protein